MKDNKNPRVVICDIDGTISRVAPARAAMLEQENPDWDAFYEDPFDDEPIEKTCGLIRHLSAHYHIVFCTSRRDSVREKTVNWLERHLDIKAFPRGAKVLMRRGGDPRPDTVVKPELVDGIIDPSEVLCVFEDSDTMAKAWSDLGYTCVKVSW